MMSKKIEFFYLNEKDMIQAGVLDMEKCVETIEEAFRLVERGDYLMGGKNENEHGLMLHFPAEKRFPNMPIKGPDRRFMAMVAYLGGKFNVCGEKWYGSNRTNTKKGLPRSILMVMLNDKDTGQPLALMSANLLSAMRTGAVPGVGAKYLAKDSEVIGIVGAGVINKAALSALAVALPKVQEVKIYDIIPSKSEEFSRIMSERTKLNVHPVGSLKEAVRDSDVVHIAASGDKRVFIKTEWLKEGSMLELSGAADYDDDLLLSSNLVLDNIKMHEAWREWFDSTERETYIPSFRILKMIDEGKLKKENVLNLGQIVENIKSSNFNKDKRTVFVATGMPVEDVAWGYQVYRNALEKGIGQKLTLWDEPYWF